MQDPLDAYWSLPPGQLMQLLGTGNSGLKVAEAQARLLRWGRNDVHPSRPPRLFALILDRFSNPLLLILIFAAIISLVLHEWIDALVVLLIVIASAAVSMVQEHRASHAVATLRRQITIRSTVLRDGQRQVIPSDELVPGAIALPYLPFAGIFEFGP